MIDVNEHSSVLEKDSTKSNRKLIEYVKTNFLDRIYADEKRFMYLVLDPINHSYNPAKAIELGENEEYNKNYPSVF
jgi:hypothetical protein